VFGGVRETLVPVLATSLDTGVGDRGGRRFLAVDVPSVNVRCLFSP
jgi:hypothetical protein